MAMLIATTVEPTTVLARSSGLASRQMLTHATSSDATDFSARRRYRRHYHGNPAAGLAIMGAMIGTIGAIAAHQHDDDYYYGGPGYYAGPGYYGPPPVYYAPRPYYGHPYYGHPYYGPRVHYYQPYRASPGGTIRAGVCGLCRGEAARPQKPPALKRSGWTTS